MEADVGLCRKCCGYMGAEVNDALRAWMEEQAAEEKRWRVQERGNEEKQGGDTEGKPRK